MFTYLAYSTLIPKLLKGKKAILFFIFVTYLCCSSTETINKDQKYNNSNYLIRKSCRNCTRFLLFNHHFQRMDRALKMMVEQKK